VRRLVVLLVGCLVALALAGCGQGEQAPEGEQAREGRQEPPGMGTGEEATGGGEVAVGGFSVEGPAGSETTVPQVSVEREAAREYLGRVRPIVEDTARDVSDLVEPEVRVENGRLEVDPGPLKDAREDVRRGLERLQEVRPPEGLEPINDLTGGIVQDLEQAAGTG
jgi:hypothetical protein